MQENGSAVHCVLNFENVIIHRKLLAEGVVEFAP